MTLCSSPATPYDVLIVEHDDAVRQVMRWALEDTGYRVATATDGMVALRLLLQGAPRLILADLEWPCWTAAGCWPNCVAWAATHRSCS
jgi:CheY-like chemotaxis protein